MILENNEKTVTLYVMSRKIEVSQNYTNFSHRQQCLIFNPILSDHVLLQNFQNSELYEV